ncbi:hypothetical protein PanWU01x14_174140 [Parasponia andersonii]|uniref:DUF4378 domain-containing protein n=1 Tax=Parasponia andersonii TaxID=3476 RepID=A0A2P5C8X6_PARAD|nr:hypothetical protein PanWU01x14_174140 [Parasponia andersonii]
MVSATVTKLSDDDHHHQTVRKSSSIMIERPKPLMLKDYLLDDLSSCSSNGFKSFPRRQCCSTVRFLLEIDLKQNQPKNIANKKQRVFRSRSRSRGFTISALRRASDAVINAVKQLPLPFPSVNKSSVQNRARKGLLLPRSLSRKLLKNRFWGKAENNSKDDLDHHTIKRSRLFPELEEHDHDQPSDINDQINGVATTSKTVASTSLVSSNSKSNSHSNSNSWCESEFTTTSSETATSANENDVSQKVNKEVDISTVGEDTTEVLGPTTATCSLNQNAKEWPNEEDKEQFSPVSVLDCPFKDDDQDETTSPFNRRLARLEGTKQKLLQKIRRFENLTQLEPVDLEKRIIAMTSELEVVDGHDHQIKIRSSSSSSNDQIEDEKAREMVAKLTETIGAAVPVAPSTNLLCDYFRERMEEDRESNKDFAEAAAMKAAEDWAVGAPTRELVLLGWEVRERSNAYVMDMEKGGKWRKLEEEKGGIGLELEALVWDSLIEEVLLDLL